MTALNPSFARIAVAIPPDPNTLTLRIVTVGASVYPNPGFVIKILSIDCPVWPSLLVIIATAVALTPCGNPVVDIPISGAAVYPVPSFTRSIDPTENPVVKPEAAVALWTVAVAVLAARPTIPSVTINPNESAAVSTASILVLISWSSSASITSHVKV